jgi:hypothetical protein
MEPNRCLLKHRLCRFYENKRIPNIIFHGSTCRKYEMMNFFIDLIYEHDKSKIKSNVMYVNCAHGKGIKFIREELKFFAKTNVQSGGGNIFFKSIVLLNADALSVDAQSALRRCIELFSNSSRFFIVVDNKNKLLKPILSRFCVIYIADERKGSTFYHHHHLTNNTTHTLFSSNDIEKINTHIELMHLAIDIYEKGFSSMDLLGFFDSVISTGTFEDGLKGHESKVDLIILFEKVKREFRSEKLLLLFLLNYIKFISGNNEKVRQFIKNISSFN